MKITVKMRRILIGVTAFFAVYTVVGFLVLPYIAKSVLLKELPEALGREVSIETIRFNPYNLRLAVRDLSVKKRSGDGDLFSFEELFINLESLSIVKMGPIVKELRLSRPYIGAVRNEDGSYSFSDLLPAPGEGPVAKDVEEGSGEGRPAVFSINNIQIVDGRVDFEDLPRKKTHDVHALTASIPFVSNLPRHIDVFVLPAFSATVNGTPFDLKGNSKPFSESRETSIELRLSELDLAHYAAYSPIPLGFELASALMDTDLSLSYSQYIARPAEVSLKGSVSLKNVKLKELSGADLFGFDSFRIEVREAELFSGKVSVAKLSLEAPYLNVVRKEGGRLNLEELLPEPSTAAPAAGKESAGPPFSLGIDDIRLRAASLSFNDLSTPTPFKKVLAPVDLSIKGFSTERGSMADLGVSYKARSGEALSVTGSVSIDPVKADLKVALKKMDISPVRSYVDEMLRIIITNGKASASGRFRLALSDEGALKASYSGDALLSGFSSISKVDKEDFLKWDTLSIDGIDASLSPNRLSVDGVALSGFFSRLIVNPDGVLNVQEIVVSEETNEAAAKEAEAPEAAPVEALEAEPFFEQIAIDSVTLHGGHVNFTDRHLKQAITLDLFEVGGRVSGLKSIKDSNADVKLFAKLGKYAPLEITGKVNPLAGDLFVDLKVDFKDFDLSEMSPYSGKYVGYEISKGKLILDLDYQIEERQLRSTNSIVIDQITFGRKVESPDATKLPVRFALNLLKNRRGAVELEVPISGSLDDPEFKVGGVIVKLIVNMIVKAVSSPFALLGAIIGGDGAELSYAEFAPGSALITEKSAGKLESLTKALFERPGLSFEIRGYVDRASDSLALRDLKFLRSIKAEKLAYIIRRGGPVPTLDDVVLEEKEYDKYLWKAYKKADFPKPKNVVGMTKKLPPEELTKCGC